MLIGDVLIAARALMPDLPRTLPAPAGLAASVVGVGGSTLPAGTYSVVFTFTNQWGETLPTAAVTGLVVGVNQGIQITAPAFSNNPAATGCRAYFAVTNQPFVQFQAQTLANGLPFTISSPGLPGTPPTRNTSFFPDSDGNALSAYTLYDWLNDALVVASYVCKGIPDTTGIQMNNGQGMYVMPGIWEKLENSWYDGFPVAFDARGGAFYRNRLSGITFICMLQTNADKQVFELQPQPSRSGGNTTVALGLPVGINDTFVNLTDTSQIGLALGLVQLGGPYPNCEIISYSIISGGQLQGCARGLGGTQQQSWAAGTAVAELNFRTGGLRQSQAIRYSPGNSAVTLQVPPGWKPAMVDYLVGKFREAEQNIQGKSESMKAFTSFLREYVSGTKQTAGPRQVGAVTSAGDGYPSASSGGRIIVP